MSILCFGGEMGFFIPSGANAIESTSAGTGASEFNSSFARCYSGASGSSTYLETPDFGAQTDFWVHVDVDQFLAVDSATLRTTITLVDDSDVEQFRLACGYHSSGEALWGLQVKDGSGWTDLGTQFTSSVSSLQTADIHIVCNSATGSATLYLSGTPRLVSGTVDLSGVTEIVKARCYGKTAGIGARQAFSQVIVADETTITMKVGTIVMTGEGATHTFTTGGFANIDELAYSDADLINSATADQVELFTGTPVPSFTGYTIRALGIYARAKKSGTGPEQMQLALRSAGTTYFSATKALDFGYGAIGNVWETNPATSVAFLSSEIAALEYGAKSIT